MSASLRRPIPLAQVRIRDPFWSERLRVLSEVTIPTQYLQIAEHTPRLSNFLRAAGVEEGPHEGYCYNDSDVYKWIEAASYAQAMHPHAPNEPLIEQVVAAVIAAQEPSGYLDTYFQLKEPDMRWRNLSAMHEMYCAGHLIEAAVARYETTGRTDLLDCARRFANHIGSVFGPGKRRGYCGHQEIELALWRLYDATEVQAYADLACYFINERGQAGSPFAEEARDPDIHQFGTWLGGWIAKNVDAEGNYVGGEYFQDHAPVREQTEVVGHAVRAMYMMCAATEQAARTDDDALLTASLRLWENLTERRMYVTGGIGPSGHNEGFTFDYDLPNLHSYAETCAAIGLALWGRRLSAVTGDAQFADIAERAIFNGALAGISLSGDSYFYANPLESRSQHERVPWFPCACCPPNIARMIGSIASFAYLAREHELTIQFPVGGHFEADACAFEVESSYPYSGDYTVRFRVAEPSEFELRLRVPEWCDEMTVDIEGVEMEGEFEGGYAVYRRTWHDGDTVKVSMEMQPTWMQADHRVLENAGRVALVRGPLVYCAEATDLGVPPQTLCVDPEAEVRTEASDLGTVCVVEGVYAEETEDGPLYQRWEGRALSPSGPATWIPYFAWCNRGKTAMEVWTREV